MPAHLEAEAFPAKRLTPPSQQQPQMLHRYSARYSVYLLYLLYWYNSTNTDAFAARAAVSSKPAAAADAAPLRCQVFSLLALLVQKYKY
jgi:hypothetical protein